MLWIALLGTAAALLSAVLWLPPSRELVRKLRELTRACESANPERFASQLASKHPFPDGRLKHNRIAFMLQVDLSTYGESCLALQQRARELDRSAHLAMLPLFLFVVGLGGYWLLG
jgi:hypothetical protein